MGTFQIVTLHGNAAVQAWHAYLRNHTHFAKEEREHAGTLAAPAVALFALPSHATAFMSSMHTEAKAIGDKAATVLSLGPLQGDAQEIMYVHTRTTFRSRRLATTVVKKYEDSVAGQLGKLLVTVGLSGEHRFDFRFFTRNGFEPSESRDVVMNNNGIGLHMWRRVGDPREEHPAFQVLAPLAPPAPAQQDGRHRLRSQRRAVHQCTRTAQALLPSLPPDCLGYVVSFLVPSDLSTLLHTSRSMRASLHATPVYRLWACNKPHALPGWYVSDGPHVTTLLQEGMHFEVLQAVVDRPVISITVVKALLCLPELRCIDLQGTVCNHTIVPALAASPNVSEIRELHLGSKCFHPDMEFTHAGTDALCNLVSKMPKLVKLTLPPYAGFASVRDVVPSTLRALAIRTAWGGGNDARDWHRPPRFGPGLLPRSARARCGPTVHAQPEAVVSRAQLAASQLGVAYDHGIPVQVGRAAAPSERVRVRVHPPRPETQDAAATCRVSHGDPPGHGRSRRARPPGPDLTGVRPDGGGPRPASARGRSQSGGIRACGWRCGPGT